MVDTQVVVAAWKRVIQKKPPLVSKIDRQVRKRRWLSRLFWRVFWRLRGHRTYVDLKWRWCRGEVRHRRLRLSVLITKLIQPIRRPVNYQEMGEKFMGVQRFDDPPGLRIY
jgi:hypothetical protein